MTRTFMLAEEKLVGLMYLPEREAMLYNDVLSRCRNGLFIGSCPPKGLPLFINFDLLVNPHVFVLGMTGAGKTYLLRTMMLKLFAVLNYSLVLIDFTGEYKEFAERAGSTTEAERVSDVVVSQKGELLYFNLKNESEAKKVERAEKVVREVITAMRSRRNGERRLFVVLDEAWKLLANSASLSTLIREGRKYGVGLIASSQLVEDLELPMLSNIATIFVFRLQNRKSIEKIVRNYGLEESVQAEVQNLDVGSCIVVQVNKFKRRDAFRVSRVVGLDFGDMLTLSFGDGMKVEVARSRFECALKSLCGDSDSDIVALIDESGQLELPALVKALLEHKVERRAVLSLLRSFGVDDRSIADSFAVAVGELSNGR